MKKGVILLTFIMAIFQISCDEDEVQFVDLGAKEITFQLSQQSQNIANVTITGIVSNNISRYESNIDQQRIVLYEREFGSTTKTMVGETTFGSVAEGISLQVSYTRSWDSSTSGQGVNPPDYILEIEFDEDIREDGNILNDDLNPDNNSLTVSGSAINDLF